MADDVKVKFSGDFKDVSKGAAEASKNAGTAMGSWVSDFTNHLKSSLVNMASLTYIFDKIIEGGKMAIQRVFELNQAMRKTSLSGEDFQKFFAISKQFGIGIETVGLSLSFFSKYMGEAQRSTATHGKALRELGFTNEEIKNGTITATDVLIALARQLEETGDKYKTAALSAEVFGRKTGKEFLIAIQQGSGALKEQSEAAKILSQAQLEAAEATERAWTRTLNKIKKLWVEATAPLLRGTAYGVIEDSVEEAEKKRKESGSGYTAKDIAEDAVKRAKELGAGLEIQKEFYKNSLEVTKKYGEPGFGSIGLVPTAVSESALSAIEKLEKEAEQKKKEQDANRSLQLSNAPTKVLAASSLQQIGGGDIASVANLYRGNMEDYTRRTAEATEKMVSQDQPASKKITSVAK